MKTTILLFTAMLIGGCATCQHSQVENTDQEEIKFAILGYISEYISRYDYDTGKPHKNLVESFYPHETSEADRFEALLIQYHQIMNQPYLVQRTVGGQGHIFFHDEWMSDQINQHYTLRGSEDDWYFHSIDQTFILNGGENSLREYIKSVYDRQGDEDGENILYLANASFLSETIAQALIACGSKWVVIHVGEGGIPTPFWVHFDVPINFDSDLKVIPDGAISDPIFDKRFREWKRYENDAQPVK